MQMPILTQRKLRLSVLLQKKYLYTCKNIVTKPNLEEFLHKLNLNNMELKIVANDIEYVWQLTGFFFIIIISLFSLLFIFQYSLFLL